MPAHLKSVALLTQFLFQRLAVVSFLLAALALSAASIETRKNGAIGGIHVAVGDDAAPLPKLRNEMNVGCPYCVTFSFVVASD